MMTPLVLPDRGAPSGSTARSGRANFHCPSSPAPSDTPPPGARGERTGPRQSGSRVLAGRGRAWEAMIVSISTSARTARISAIATPVAPTGPLPRSHHAQGGDLHRWPCDPPAVRVGLLRRSRSVRSVGRTYRQPARRLVLQQPLDPRAQEPPRPPKPTRRQLPAAREMVDGRHRKVQKLGDLRGGHHLIPGQRHPRSLVARAGHLRGRREHACHYAGCPGRTQGHLGMSPRTSWDDLGHLDSTPGNPPTLGRGEGLENEHLSTAITRAGLTLEEFADIVQGRRQDRAALAAGRTPYRRQGAARSTRLSTRCGPTLLRAMAAARPKSV